MPATQKSVLLWLQFKHYELKLPEKCPIFTLPPTLCC